MKMGAGWLTYFQIASEVDEDAKEINEFVNVNASIIEGNSTNLRFALECGNDKSSVV